jgi:dienelactone hydrolase
MKTAAALPDRIGAGASFHGGGLVTDKPDSPHLLAPKIKARMYFGVASNDDARQPDAKDKLKEAFAAAKVPAEIEVYAGACTAGACRICPHRMARRSTTSRTPSALGENSTRTAARATDSGASATPRRIP